MATDEEMRDVLANSRTIAVVGLSANRERDSNQVAAYLQAHGYRVIPVNPNLSEVLGERAYPDIDSIPENLQIDIVDIFRRSDQVPPVVEAALRRRVPTIWMQLGVASPAAASRARASGVRVFEDLCIMQQHRRLRIPAHRAQE